MRPRMSASQACGSTTLSLAVPIRVYIASALVPPRSEPEAGEPHHLRGPRRGPLGLKLVELEFELVEQALLAFRASPVELAPELPDPQPEEGDLRRGIGHLRGGVACLGLG